MDDLFFARSQMAVSLAFHIIFAVVGIGVPLLMCIAEGLYLRTREAIYLELSRQWARGTAVLFAVGAVSRTVLLFELGLLWPRFMEYAGGIIGMPFSLEGFAFFIEAIFLGIASPFFLDLPLEAWGLARRRFREFRARAVCRMLSVSRGSLCARPRRRRAAVCTACVGMTQYRMAV